MHRVAVDVSYNSSVLFCCQW